MVRVLALILFFVSFSLSAQETSESVFSGTVIDNAENPVPYANIYIQELDKGTAADEFGHFQMTNIPYGQWKISISSVGYKTMTEVIIINEPKINDVIFQLRPGHELDQLEVFGIRNDKPEKFESFTRLPLNPYDQLQSISIISNKLIESQGNLTLSDATKNVPGVYTFATYGNKRESMSSRGFRGIPILKNGVRVHSDFRGVGLLTD